MSLRQTLSVIVCVLVGVPASAQVTITSSDVGSYLAVGTTVTQIKDTLATSLNIGIPGATSWDFSGLQTHSVTTLASVTVAGTPFAGLVPGATHALKTTISGAYPGLNVTGVTFTVDADVYLYYTVGNALERPATMAGGTLHITSPITTDVPAELRDIYVPKDTNYVLPMTMGTSWTSTFTDTTIVFLSGGRFQTTYLDHKFSYTVDAWGTMKMPGGGTYDALRIRRVDSGPSPYLVYIFVAKNGASVTVTAADLGQPNSGVIQIGAKSLTWSPPSGPLPVQLSYFRAARTDGGSAVTLTWGTVSETNNYGFEVQRRQGKDGEFTSLPGSFVAGNGTTIVPHAYSYVDNTSGQGTWYYRLKQTDLSGSYRYSEPQSITITTGVEISSQPLTTSLAQNYPNPFNGYSRITYALATTGRVRIAVMDLLGREVTELVNGDKAAGNFSVDWDASSHASGTYVVRMTFQADPQTAGETQVFSRRITLIR